jgi:hypothetical protein
MVRTKYVRHSTGTGTGMYSTYALPFPVLVALYRMHRDLPN